MYVKNRRGRFPHQPATRIISLILSLAMLFSITAGLDFSAYADVFGDWVYLKIQDAAEEKDGIAEIIGYNGSDLFVEVPSKVSDGKNDFVVTSIGDGAFSGCSSISEIKIPDTVTVFGNMAFSDCLGLTKITFPNKITSLGEKAFYGCKKLTEIIMPDSAESIGNWAFADCFSLKEISIPDGVTNIGNYTFSNCSGLMKITMPNCVISIGDWAFYKCSSLEQTAIPNSVIDIGQGAFCDCSNLIEIEIPDSVASINYAVFWNCKKLEKITIPDSVTSIGNNAFEYCTRLSEIEIPDSVVNIGDYAFYSCKKLTDIEILDSVISIGEQAFYGCSALTDITILNNNCDIFDSKYTIPITTVINGYKNSSAQAYSEKYGNQFKDIEEIVDIPDDDNKPKIKFVDLDGYEDYNDYVMYTSVYNHFIKGTNPYKYTLFSPADSITRAMFVTILYRMAGEPYKYVNPYETSPFTDITDTSVYYYDAACWALKNGITTETTFKPFNNVTREQTATFLYRYAQDNDKIGGADYKNVNLNAYHDGNSISHFAVDAMKWANYNGMITGTEQGYANPQGATQRIHATKILYGFGKVCNIGNFE